MSPPFDLGPRPHLGYTQSKIDRVAERRLDKDWLAGRLTDAGTRAFVIGGELIVLKAGSGVNDPLFTPEQARTLAPLAETVFLGLFDGEPRFGIGIAQASAEALKTRNDLVVTDLRSIAIQGLVAPEHLPPLAEAKAMLHWHARHRFCSNCGAPTDLVEAGWKRACPACKGEHFPRTDPVVIMLTVNGDKGLLGRSGRFAATMWSCLAGFVEPGEAIEDAVRRETLEEAGVKCGRVKYLYSQPWPFPMSLMIGAHAEALNDDLTMDQNELVGLRWFSKDECAAMLMRKHPEGLTCPPPVAIAHHIIRSWVESDGPIF
ncbi:MAG: NAD(+) diphosphatase [Xanthobacteraceae bacterium]|nr:NAD(+) diphosphatase [Xanthobacteraceae bacterium]